MIHKLEKNMSKVLIEEWNEFCCCLKFNLTYTKWTCTNAVVVKINDRRQPIKRNLKSEISNRIYLSRTTDCKRVQNSNFKFCFLYYAYRSCTKKNFKILILNCVFFKSKVLIQNQWSQRLVISDHINDSYQIAILI